MPRLIISAPNESTFLTILDFFITQQDGRGKKTANLVWQAWQYSCLKEFLSNFTGLSHKVCRLFSSPVLLRKFTINFSTTASIFSNWWKSQEWSRNLIRMARWWLIVAFVFWLCSIYSAAVGIINRSFGKRPEKNNVFNIIYLKLKITTRHARNSPVTFVTHKSFAVLFLLPSRCLNSLFWQLGTPFSGRCRFREV